jgi:anti-sigma regulatory factor (Ser/Thr protein kinase)
MRERRTAGTRELAGRSSSKSRPTIARLEERKFPPEVTSVGEARRFAAEVLAACPLPTVQDVQLIVSELATNCVLHAKTEFRLRVSVSADQVRVEVGDNCPGFPVLRQPQGEQARGRGLAITDALSTVWGVESRGRREGDTRGKVVWSCLPAHNSGEDVSKT